MGAFGASSADGVRIWVDNQLVVDRWMVQQSYMTPNYSNPIQMTAGQRKPIRMEYFQGTNFSRVHLVVLGPSDDPAVVRRVVPASWLSHATGGLPRGWTLAPAGVPYAAVRVGDRGLTFTDPSGSARSYLWSGAGAGFVPAQEEDGVAAQDSAGLVTLHGADGRTTTFDVWGGVETLSHPSQDGTQTAIAYGWSADAGRRRLLTMRDPHSNRTATLRYGGRDICPVAVGFDLAPTDMLCQVAWWDGTTTDLFY